MKSKKIERLENEIKELENQFQYPDIVNQIAKLRKQIKATRNRNLWAAERYQAHRDCGLVKTPYGWE